MNNQLRRSAAFSYLLYLFGLFGPAAVVAQDAGPPPPMTMTTADAVSLALRQNTTIDFAFRDRIVEKFNLVVAEDKFSLKPTLSVAAQQNSTNFDGRLSGALNSVASANLTKIFPTGAQLGVTATESLATPTAGEATDFGSGRDTLWNVTVTQPLLKGGGIEVNTASVTTAQIGEKLNRLALKSTVMGTVTTVISSFRAYLLAMRQLEISREALGRAQDLLAMNKELIAAGRMAEVELVQSEDDVANTELSLLTSENGADSARLALVKLLNLDKHTKIDPAEETVVEPLPLSYEQCKELAFRQRPDYQGALLGLEILKLNLLLAKDNKLWDLSLVGGYGEEHARDGLSGNSSSIKNWNSGLKLTVPLQDLAPKQGFISAKVGLDKAGIQLVKLRDTIEIEVQDALRDLEIKLRQVKLSQRSRTLSEKKLAIENEKLKAGRTSNFQIVSFQNDLKVAQNNEQLAVINYLNALTGFDVTLGVTLDKWQIPLAERYQEETYPW